MIDDGIVLVYMMLTLLCLVLITLFTILSFNKKSLCKESEPFVNRYTESDIDNDWNSLKCSFSLPNRIKQHISTLGNMRNDPNARQKALNYLVNYANNNNCKGININIPNSELLELQQLWRNTNCKSPFPIQFIQNQYNKKLKYVAIKSMFFTYINNINKNLTNNDAPTESLESSFNKCYGSNWRDDSTLKNQYDYLNSLT